MTSRTGDLGHSVSVRATGVAGRQCGLLSFCGDVVNGLYGSTIGAGCGVEPHLGEHLPNPAIIGAVTSSDEINESGISLLVNFEARDDAVRTNAPRLRLGWENDKGRDLWRIDYAFPTPRPRTSPRPTTGPHPRPNTPTAPRPVPSRAVIPAPAPSPRRGHRRGRSGLLGRRSGHRRLRLGLRWQRNGGHRGLRRHSRRRGR
jgi:hypothetical protein